VPRFSVAAPADPRAESKSVSLREHWLRGEG
jgi:hypothetical protein